MSQNTGCAPNRATTPPDAKNVNGVVTTSSPGPTSSAISATNSATFWVFYADGSTYKSSNSDEHPPGCNGGAGFHCAAVLVYPDEIREPLVTEAVWRGTVLRQRQGTGGFGYDPIFLLPDLGKSISQISMEEKNKISHRGQALHQFIEFYRDRLQ